MQSSRMMRSVSIRVSDMVHRPEQPRRRVYILGGLSMVMAVMQLAWFLFALSLTISTEHADTEVAVGAVIMIVMMTFYVSLTGRLLFLLYENRMTELKTTEWVWWLTSLAAIILNLVLVVWYAMLEDPVPACLLVFSVIVFIVFFWSTTKDIKRLREPEKPGAQ